MHATNRTQDTASSASTPRPDHLPRLTGIFGLLTAATFTATVVVAAKPDLTTSTALHAFLEDSGPRLFVAWVLALVSGLAWVGFVVGLRTLLAPGAARDLFTFAALIGQAAHWVAASLDAAAAPSGAHDISITVYDAIGEAAHLTGAAGLSVTGLALVGLAAAAATTARPWPRAFTRLTAVTGVFVVLTSVVGPLSLPAFAVWTVVAGILLLRDAHAA